MSIRRFYVHPAFSSQHLDNLRRFFVENGIEHVLEEINAEICFHVVFSNNFEIPTADLAKVKWFLSKNLDGLSKLNENSFFTTENDEIILEFGPRFFFLKKFFSYFFFTLTKIFRLSFTTPFSTNAVSALHSAGLKEIKRVEKSFRYFLKFSSRPSNLQIENVIFEKF